MQGHSSIIGLLLLGLDCALASWALVRVVMRWSLARKIMDVPNERSSHMLPTPRGGGLAVVVVTLFAAAVLALAPTLLTIEPTPEPRVMWGLLAAALLIAGVSLADDMTKGLSPSLRFAVHASAAMVAIYACGYWRSLELPWLGRVEVGWLGLPLTLLWIVGVVNFFNFMDGIDGLAGVQALAGAAGWAAWAFVAGDRLVVALAVALMGATLGFLRHNWPPAKIFLGDVGSAFLGFGFAAIPLLAARGQERPVAERLPLAGALMIAPFVIDATFTLLRRLVRGERITEAHRSHLYQRLVITGLSHGRVALAYLGLGLAGAAAGVYFLRAPGRGAAGLAALAAIAAIGLVPWAWAVSRERRAREGH